jgi:CRISPR system Cascade subunit CasC
MAKARKTRVTKVKEKTKQKEQIMSNNFFIDFHVIQTLPPSCVNRDDIGRPKTAVYGGIQRARVSSQSWKRAMRDMFEEEFDEEQRGVRTKEKIVGLVADKIRILNPKLQKEQAIGQLEKEGYSLDDVLTEEQAIEQLAQRGLSLAKSKGLKKGQAIGQLEKEGYSLDDVLTEEQAIEQLAQMGLTLAISKTTKKTKKPSEEDKKVSADIREGNSIWYVSRWQAQALAKVIVEAIEQSEQISRARAKEALSKGHGVAISLFGRMVAHNPTLNTDASAQVAHVISTHRVENESDYFTAVDDLASKDSSGAIMIGTAEYNASTLYRYATVAAHVLGDEKHIHNNPDLAAKAIREFARAFIDSMPTGKQNAYANYTPPDAILVNIRTDRPINFVGAFEEPVISETGGFVKGSCAALVNYANQLYAAFDIEPQRSLVVGERLAALGELVKKSQLFDLLHEEAARYLSGAAVSNGA